MERKKVRNWRFFTGIFVLTWTIAAALTGLPVAQATLGKSATLTQDFTLSFTKAWNEGTTNEHDVTVPDVASVVANITSYIDPAYTTYVGAQVPAKTLDKYQYRLSATYIWVYDNHDTFTDGDLHLRGEVNQLVDDEMDNTKQWDYSIGTWGDYAENFLAVTLYTGWAAYISGLIQLYDSDDLGMVDSFGTWQFDFWNQTRAGDWLVDYGGDATVEYRVEILAGPQAMTAAELLDAYKPYLWEDMETSHHDPPELVTGRVIEGQDTSYGKATSCLQYIYAYADEYTGTDVFVHYWDWEMVIIFVDLNAGGSVYPYRVVWAMDSTPVSGRGGTGLTDKNITSTRKMPSQAPT